MSDSPASPAGLWSLWCQMRTQDQSPARAVVFLVMVLVIVNMGVALTEAVCQIKSGAGGSDCGVRELGAGATAFGRAWGAGYADNPDSRP